jgi:hypothetical protein
VPQLGLELDLHIAGHFRVFIGIDVGGGTGSLTIFDSNVTDMFRVRFATYRISHDPLRGGLLTGGVTEW